MAKVNAKHLLVKTKSAGVDPKVDEILAGGALATLYKKTQGFYLSSVKKGYIEACLLASQDLNKISELLELPLEEIEFYQEFFFDIRGFDKLSLLEVIDNSDGIEERGMKIWALNQGLDFIAWRLGKSLSISPVDGLQDLFTLSVFKSKEALFSGSNSDASKNAANWTKMSLDLAKVLKSWVSDADAAKSDIEMALKTIEPDFGSLDSVMRENANPIFKKEESSGISKVPETSAVNPLELLKQAAKSPDEPSEFQFPSLPTN